MPSGLRLSKIFSDNYQKLASSLLFFVSLASRLTKTKIETRLTDTHLRLISSLIFFVAFALFWRFLDLFRNAVPQSFTVFWLLILGMFVPLLYQIFSLRHQSRWEGVIIFQILLLIWSFLWLTAVQTDKSFFISDDNYTILSCIEYIQHGGRDFLIGGGPDYGKWPFNHIFLLNISLVSGLSLFDTLYWIPSVVSTLGAIFVYLMVKTVYHDSRVALLTLLTFGSFYQFVWTHHSSHPEYLGIMFIFACLYIYLKRLQHAESATKYASLAILFMVALPFINITSNAMLVFFFLILLLASLLFNLVRAESRNLAFGYRDVAVFVTLTVVAGSVYWMYVTRPIFEHYILALTELRSPTYFPHEEAAIIGTEPTLFKPGGPRENISGWGRPLYAVTFGCIMLYEVIRNRKCERWSFDMLFALWAGAGLVLFLFTGLFPVAKYAASHLGNRVQSFVYPFMLMAVAHVGFRLRPRYKQVLFYLLILGFLLVNVASWHFVPSNLFARSFHPLDYGDNQQEWASMDYLLPIAHAESIVVSYQTAHYYKYSWGVSPYVLMDVFENDLLPLKEGAFDYVVMKSQEPYFLVPNPRRSPIPVLLDEATLALIQNTPWLEKRYDNQEWVIYRVIH